METYWNGKQTDSRKKLSELVKVDMGWTENKFVNAYLAVNKIYYDIYNNGGCNLVDDSMDYNSNYRYLEKLIVKILDGEVGHKFGYINLAKSIESIYFDLMYEDSNGEYIKLENFVDEIYPILASKDLDFKIYKVYQEYEKEKLTFDDMLGHQEGWSIVTFGLEKDWDEWIRHRLEQWNFEMINVENGGV